MVIGSRTTHAKTLGPITVIKITVAHDTGNTEHRTQSTTHDIGKVHRRDTTGATKAKRCMFAVHRPI